jgi:hypothetical protein
MVGRVRSSGRNGLAGQRDPPFPLGCFPPPLSFRLAPRPQEARSMHLSPPALHQKAPMARCLRAGQGRAPLYSAGTSPGWEDSGGLVVRPHPGVSRAPPRGRLRLLPVRDPRNSGARSASLLEAPDAGAAAETDRRSGVGDRGGSRRPQGAHRSPAPRPRGHPGSNPQSQPAKTKRSPAPAVHAATRAVRRELRNAYFSFVAACRSAAEKLRAGNRKQPFPRGCFLLPCPSLEVRQPAKNGGTRMSRRSHAATANCVSLARCTADRVNETDITAA